MNQHVTASPLTIACTLGAVDFKERMNRIAGLNARALQDHHRVDLQLVLIYRAEAREEVLAMVRDEQACCAFLNFDVQDEPDVVRVVITAPPAARESAEAIFASFVSNTPSGATREGCCRTGETDDRSAPPTPRARRAALGATAAVAATGALACGVCCALPFALPAAALAMSGGVLAWFSDVMPWFTAIAVLAVSGAWIAVGLGGFRSKRKPAWSTLIALGWATLMLVGAMAWGQIEDPVRHALGG